MTAFDVVEQKLRNGMVRGEMHGCLRDVGRLAGGYASTGAISAMELFTLEELAVGLSINASEGRDKWTKSVVFGRGQPVDWQEYEEYAQTESKSLDWGDEIGVSDKLKVVDPRWIQDEEVPEPKNWDPKAELIKYLSTLFQGDDHVAYSTGSWEKDGKRLPERGAWDRTSSQLITALQSSDDVGGVMGDCHPEAGAWCRINPFDGNGVKDANVTEFRYALVECDSMPIPRQFAILKELELPIATLVHSGKKSLHAAVRIEADSMESYRKRVDFLYEVCKKNGLDIDRQNRNPSRLSRMPGVLRNGKKQFLIGTHLGKTSWQEWEDWIQEVNDDLPDFECLSDVFDNPPDKSPELIKGVLREGHKMRLAGPSKAGKSFSLKQLCVGIAEGRDWCGWECRQGPVLYVNLELDRASCLHRFVDIYKAKGWRPDNIKNIDIWNLRGKAVPMDKLAPKLIRRAAKKNYVAIVIDPIYKVITGDENSAEAMSHFCNQFDRICNELGAAVIDCHHHSKGAQGGKKSSDRASGSGVFARDPDALIDLVELNGTDAKKVLINRTVCDAMSAFLTEKVSNWRDHVNEDDALSSERFELAAKRVLVPKDHEDLLRVMVAALKKCEHVTAWRMEGTLREFASFKPREMWFKYPIHEVEDNLLQDALIEGEDPPRSAKKKTKTDEKIDQKQSFLTALNVGGFDGPPTVAGVSKYMGIAEGTLRKKLIPWGYRSESGQIVSNAM